MLSSCGGSSGDCNGVGVLLGSIATSTCNTKKDDDLSSRSSEVFTKFQQNAIGGYTFVRNSIIDSNINTPLHGCGFDGSKTATYDQSFMTKLATSNGVTINESNATKWCAGAGDQFHCLMDFGTILIQDSRGTNTFITIDMIGLIDGAVTQVIYDSVHGSSISSRSKVLLPAVISDCPDLANQQLDSIASWQRGGGYSSPTSTIQSATAIDGAWVGYKAAYSAATMISTTSSASLTCFNQVCSASDLNGVFFTLNQQFDNGTWKTDTNAAKVVGAAISDDRRLLSLFLCNTPLTVSNTLDACSFYTLKR